MTVTRVLSGLSVVLLFLVLQSPQGAGATRDALSAVDDAVAHASPFVARQPQLRSAAQLLQRLGNVAREGLTRGDGMSTDIQVSAPGNTST
jgi:hypothetical protein